MPAAGSPMAAQGAEIVVQAHDIRKRFPGDVLALDRVSLQVEEAGGQRAIYVYDLAAGRMVGRFAIEYRQ